jgi:hypothetical protein
LSPYGKILLKGGFVMFDDSVLHSLTIEYLKAKYDISALNVNDYFSHYLEIYNLLKNLNNDLNKSKKSELASKYLNGK